VLAHPSRRDGMIQSDVVRVVECAAAAREQLPRRRRQAFTSVIG